MQESLIFIAAGALLIILNIILVIWLWVTQRRWKAFMKAPAGDDLQETLTHIKDVLHILDNHGKKLSAATRDLDQRLSGSVRGIATVRYDAFPDMGGKQSFAAALVTESGDGVVISSIHSRARVSSYAKPIENFTSTHELSPEETRAIREAHKNL